MAAINVLVVDDSVVIRRLVTTILDGDPDIRVVGTAANGRIALNKIPQLAPDLITLDIEMPELDGLATLRELRALYPRLPVIMFSTLTERAASATLEALSLGANDYVTKPANVGSVQAGMDSIRSQMLPRIKALCARQLPPSRQPLARVATTGTALTGTALTGTAMTGTVTTSTATPTVGGPVEVLVIGCSTGGPDALTEVLPALPADFPLPVVVVQHMPPVFTKLFAQRLDARCALEVKEAEAGDAVRPGRVLIAPGDFHLVLTRDRTGVRAQLNQATPENWCRPAADPLFRSAAEVYGARVLAVVLTGMGQDGVRGSERIVAAGGRVVVQDEATSVVWGMPGAVASAGLAGKVLPLRGIAPEVLGAVGRGRSLTAGAGAR